MRMQAGAKGPASRLSGSLAQAASMLAALYRRSTIASQLAVTGRTALVGRREILEKILRYRHCFVSGREVADRADQQRIEMNSAILPVSAELCAAVEAELETSGSIHSSRCIGWPRWPSIARSGRRASSMAPAGCVAS